ncbi:MAG: Uma2 family endonuclease [Chloroflexia bacterium]
MATQAIQIEKRLLTLEEYERMIEAGVFDEDERIELIRGEIVKMAPIGPPHEASVARLTTLLVQKTVGKAIVWPQNNSIRLPTSGSRPEPDLTLLRWREDYYGTTRPATAADVLLVIEVAESSIKYDQTIKGRLYAEAGIPEYWIVNLQDEVIEVYTEPTDGAYKQAKKARRGETLPLPGELGDAIAVSDILGSHSET